MSASSGVADGRTSGSAGSTSAANAAARIPSDGVASESAAMRAALDGAVLQHDRASSAAVPVWLGAEPTFTDRYSESREWLCEALGADKEARASKLLARLLERQPGAAVLRPLGRQYANEPRPRWCHGIYAKRNGEPAWAGPVDAIADGEPTPASLERLPRLRDALLETLTRAGWTAVAVSTPDPTPLRVACRRDGQPVSGDARTDVRLARESIHADAREPVPDTAPVDQLAADGVFLLLLHAGGGRPAANDAWVELPATPDVPTFLALLDALGRAARQADIGAMGLRGFPPAVDASVAWTTLTPDPAVLEINQAPESTLAAFRESTRVLFELAAAEGLSPYRLHYNGAVSDSGGGGQLTFGGPSPAESPFFSAPQLLPRLIRYLIRHPSLSYWFATQYVGGSSQSPRPDEGVRESFVELELGLEQLALLESPRCEMIWSTLRHFLADASGNPHRSELNIEKLFNRFLPGRGCLGLVEFRALAMPQSAELATARALLLRSLIVMLSQRDVVTRLVHWGDELHDRFALPFFLRQDLREVFSDLDGAGLGLGQTIEEALLGKDAISLGQVETAQYRLNVQQALEFWPLVGDVASQEGGGSRLVDASTARIQLRVDPIVDTFDPADLSVIVKGHRVPLRAERAGGAPVYLIGLRFRSFVPWSGLHPAIGAEKTVPIVLRHRSGDSVRVTLFPWRPNGEAYPGLPNDLADAAARRVERFVVERSVSEREVAGHSVIASAVPDAPSHVTTPYCVDLRRLPASTG
ncbi:MAG TPA: transglutaminase family protein [Polyangiaceae bacterium]|nr:transglutaminase family protein [Polyangiaceae bacterium]